MNRQSFILIGIIAVIGLLAILMTLQGAPESFGDPGFSTPTLTFTPTSTTEAETLPAIPPGFDPGADERTNCTYPIETWLDHPSAWGLESIRIGSIVYNQNEMLAIMSVPSERVIDDLLQQLFIVVINQRFGADATVVLEAIVQATDWLNQHAGGDQMTDDEVQLAIQFASTFRAFNRGEIGPGSCDFPITQRPVTPTATQAPTDVSNPPAGTAVVATPTATPTATPVTFIIATPTTRPAIGPTATATRPPGDNPPPPTSPPAPTFTSPPPPPPTSPPPEPSPTSPPPPPTPAPTQEPDPPTPTQAPPP
jgi:hypothetical protein